MDTTFEKIDNSVINAYTERCTRLSENVRKLQEQVQNFKTRFLGGVNEQQAMQSSIFDEQIIVEQASTMTPQPSISVDRVTPDEIDIDALVNEIAIGGNNLEI